MAAAADIVDDATLLLHHYDLLRPRQQAQEAVAGEEAGPRLAAKFEATLSHDIGIVDLSRASFGRVGMRWRTMDEVAAGKGDRICAAVHCSAGRPLVQLELPFGWKSNASESSRVALIATVVCRRCAAKLVQARAVGAGMPATTASRSPAPPMASSSRRTERPGRKKRHRRHSVPVPGAGDHLPAPDSPGQTGVS